MVNTQTFGHIEKTTSTVLCLIATACVTAIAMLITYQPQVTLPTLASVVSTIGTFLSIRLIGNVHLKGLMDRWIHSLIAR